MAKPNLPNSALVDGVIKILVVGGSLGSAMILPNLGRALDKSLDAFFKKMDTRTQARELKRTLYYMKRQGLIETSPRGYDHGIRISNKGRTRLKEVELEQMRIPKPTKWDQQWRLVLYDIPEKYKAGRDALTRLLRQLGFYQLQRSVWVHPYPCREEVAAVSAAFDVNRYVSYIETGHIDQQHILRKRFKI